MSIRVRVTPRTQILNSKEWKRAVKKAQKKSVRPSKTEMEKVTPVDTGYMKSRWNVEPASKRLEITNDASYAGFVNDGTRFIAPQRFVEKALPKVEDLYEKNIADEVEKIN